MIPFNMVAVSLLSFSLLLTFPVSGGEWNMGVELAVPRSEMRGAVIGERIFIAGGYGGEKVLEAFHTGTQSWERLMDMPEGLDHHMVAAHGEKFYVFKGKTWQYEPMQDNWEEKSGSTYRGDGTAVEYGDFIYILGGGPKVIERYHPESDTWEELAELQESRGHVNAVVLNEKIYILGGRNNTGALKTVEIYDPADNTITYGPSMQKKRSGNAAVSLLGKIYVAGGEVKDESGAVSIENTLEVFDPGTGEWSFRPEPPIGVHGSASIVYDSKFYMIGGSMKAYAVDNTGAVQIYYPAVPLVIRNKDSIVKTDARSAFSFALLPGHWTGSQYNRDVRGKFSVNKPAGFFFTEKEPAVR